uniref:Uncharacterized protein n=1 Tax=Oryza barthii TaxID=65489 RepID=A0A0D3HFC3_9ORYZ
MKLLLLPPSIRRGMLVTFFLACFFLAELAGFSHGRRVMEDKEDDHSEASSEEQLYELPRTRGRPFVSAPSPAYEASDRPVPQGSNPLHNR